MDPDQEKNQNNSTPNGGIFSTPDLTVDANKIANPTQNNDKSRIASIFANTDAGRESQRLNDAMGANTTENSQPLEGDLVIQNEPKKKSKWPPILIVAALVVVVIGLVAWMIIGGSGETQKQKTAKEVFNEYASLVKAGPPNLSGISSDTENRWFLFNLNSLNLTDSDYDNYLVELSNVYNVLIEKNIQTELSEGLRLHRQILELLTNYYSLNKIDNKLTDKYLQEGDMAAQSYINELTPNTSNQGTESESIIDIAENLEHNYLDARLNLLRRYKISGCIVENELDADCAISNSQIQQEEQSAAELRESLASLIPLLENDFQKTINAIQNSLERI